MFGWIFRIILIVSGMLAGWFVAQDATNFTFVQGMFSILLMAAIVAIVAFWPKKWSFRKKSSPDGHG